MIPALDYAALSQLINRVWSRLERDDYDAVIAHLTADCRWERGGRMFVGHDEIRASLEQRPTGRLVRHQVSNLMVDRDGDDYVCTYLMAAYNNEGAPQSAPPYAGVTPRFIVECVDRCRREGDSFRIRAFGLVLLFRA